MDYLELRFTEILWYKVEKRIHFELIAMSMSRDELGKMSGQRGQGRVKSTGKPDFGLFEIKLQLLTPTRNLTSLTRNLTRNDPLTTKTRCDPTERWGALCG